MGRIRARLAGLLASAGAVLGIGQEPIKPVPFQPPLNKAATRYERKQRESYRSKWRARHVSTSLSLRFPQARPNALRIRQSSVAALVQKASPVYLH